MNARTTLTDIAPPAVVHLAPDPAARALLHDFERWRRQNHSGGAALRWRRRSVWVAQLRQRLGQHVEVDAPLFFGERMRVVTGENASRFLLTFGYSEVALTALMLHLLRPGDVVVDIGTHFGYEAMLAARLVGPAGRVIGFEPHPASRALAARNLARFAQAELRPEALASSPGVMRLANNPIERSAFNALLADDAAGDHIDVPVTTLDDAVRSLPAPVTLLKCDAEGFERPILDGGRALIGRDAPVIVLEADMPSADGVSSPRAFELAAHLESYGYVGCDFDYDGALRISPLGERSVQHANVLFLPRARPELLERLGLASLA